MSDNNNNDKPNSDNGGEVTALHDLIAGGIAGSASVVVGHPFDTIKVRLQTSSASSKGSSTAGGLRSLFTGMGAPLSTAAIVNAIIFASYGKSTRLWEDAFENGQHDNSEVHGVWTWEGGGMLEHGNKGTHEQVKGWKKQQGQHLSTDPLGSSSESELKNQKSMDDISETSLPYEQNMLKVFTCGSIAGTVQALVICPMEHIKCRLQVQAAALASASSSASSSVASDITGARAFSSVAASNPQTLYKGPVDCGLSIIRNHGFFRGLYRGMGVTLWRETPAFGMYFATYDSIKSRVESLLEDKDDHHPIPSHAHAWAASALAGGISGAWTWAIIYPFDVIKSRIQTSPLDRHLQKDMWTVAKEIVEENGWRYMFRGLGVTLARAFPVNAIIFPVYEFVLLQLGDGE
jgi:solute carrier family 25 carnitine/acylcarnitine transporter 20/29